VPFFANWRDYRFIGIRSRCGKTNVTSYVIHFLRAALRGCDSLSLRWIGVRGRRANYEFYENGRFLSLVCSAPRTYETCRFKISFASMRSFRIGEARFLRARFFHAFPVGKTLLSPSRTLPIRYDYFPICIHGRVRGRSAASNHLQRCHTFHPPSCLPLRAWPRIRDRTTASRLYRCWDRSLSIAFQRLYLIHVIERRSK